MYSYIGDKIRDLRIEKGLKQAYMATRLNIESSTWCQYEKNKRTPSIESLKAIASEFKTSIDYLVGRVEMIYDPNEKLFKQIVQIYNSLDEMEKKQLTDILSSEKQKRKLINIIKSQLNQGR